MRIFGNVTISSSQILAGICFFALMAISNFSAQAQIGVVVVDIFQAAAEQESSTNSELQQSEFEIYPNPVNLAEDIYIRSLRGAIVEEIEIRDAYGMPVFQTIVDEESFQVPYIEPGLHYVRLLTSEGIETHTIWVE
ncbi:MAG: T9SS type A sorting domain-containing protein [Bacteroidota bacterium]